MEYGLPDRKTCWEEHIAIWKSSRNDVRRYLSSPASCISNYTVFPYAPNSSWKTRIEGGYEKKPSKLFRRWSLSLRKWSQIVGTPIIHLLTFNFPEK